MCDYERPGLMLAAGGSVKDPARMRLDGDLKGRRKRERKIGWRKVGFDEGDRGDSGRTRRAPAIV
jgi:hypothetical protein